jgi:hypothetical protein
MTRIPLGGGQECELDNAFDYGVVVTFKSNFAEDERGEATISFTAAQALQLARALLKAVESETDLLDGRDPRTAAERKAASK